MRPPRSDCAGNAAERQAPSFRNDVTFCWVLCTALEVSGQSGAAGGWKVTDGESGRPTAAGAYEWAVGRRALFNNSALLTEGSGAEPPPPPRSYWANQKCSRVPSAPDSLGQKISPAPLKNQHHWGGGGGGGGGLDPRAPGAALRVMSFSKPPQSQDLQTWCCGLVAWP